MRKISSAGEGHNYRPDIERESGMDEGMVSMAAVDMAVEE